jgi:ATP-binding cassette subfamily B protein
MSRGTDDERDETDEYSGNSMWRLYAEYGRDNALKGVVGVLGTVFARFLGLIPAFILGLAIDGIFLDQRAFALPFIPAEWIPTTTDGQLVLSIGLIVGATVLGAAVTWTQNWGWNAFAQNVQHALRVDTYEAMQALDMGFFDERQTGELLSILNNDVNQLESFLNDGLSSALRIGSMIIGIGAIMAALNPQLALVALLPVPVLAAFTYLFVRTIRPKYAAMRESVGTLNSRLENNLGGMEVIKTETAESYEAERVEGASQGYFDANWDAITTRIRFFPGLRIISGIGFALTFAVGGFWVLSGPPLGLSGTLTAGSFVTFMIYTRQFIWPMAQFGQIINKYQRAKASSERVYGLINEPGRLAEDDGTDFDGGGRVEFEDVTFGYDDESVVSNVDLQVSEGETIGLVGPTGAGKSTLLKLLIRMYDPDEGTVRIEGMNIRDVPLGSLRESIGYVSQEPFLFGGSVKENIAYGTFDATDEEIREAASAARAHEFVANLPEGYETTVGERGVKLSGGQRQRLSIARTILKDPDVLILDEATSHVDTETEALIQHSLDAFAAEKTTFAIAHRLSTIKNADEIVVLEDGRITKEGTHDDLLANEGLYANFWQVQAGDAETLPQEFIEQANRRRAEVNG